MQRREEGRKEGGREGAAWLGSAQFPPPRVRLSKTGKRGAGTEPRPFPSTRCLDRGKKRGERKAEASSSLSPSPAPAATTVAATPVLRLTRCEGG